MDVARGFSYSSSEGRKQYEALYDANSKRTSNIAVGGISDVNVLR